MRNPAKVKVGAVAVAVLAMAGVIVWQHQRAGGLMQEGAALREQAAQVASLREEIQRLTGALKAADERPETEKGELMRLRAQVAALRQTEQENARLKAERDRSAKQPPQAEFGEEQQDRMLGQGAHARLRHGMLWGRALFAYASEHQGQFPATFLEAAPFLGNDQEASGAAPIADQYEMLYHGRRADMTNPPPEGAIIVREKQPWLTKDGQWARAYIYGNGMGSIHTEPDGNFDKWESPRLPKISGQ